MILRRLTDAFRKQDWFTVAVETLIVVLGVFLGIQLGNWNEARVEKHLSRTYVDRLINELQLEQQTIEIQIDYYTEVLAAVRRAAALLEDEEADPKELVASAYRATEVLILARTDATWTQMTASGDLTLLPQDTIPLLNYSYSFDAGGEALRTLSASDYRRAVRQIIPIEVQDAIRTGCGDQANKDKATIGFMEDCNIDVDPSLLRSTAEALRDDTAVALTLNYQYSDVRFAIGNLASKVPVLRRALDAMGAPPGDEGVTP